MYHRYISYSLHPYQNTHIFTKNLYRKRPGHIYTTNRRPFIPFVSFILCIMNRRALGALSVDNRLHTPHTKRRQKKKKQKGKNNTKQNQRKAESFMASCRSAVSQVVHIQDNQGVRFWQQQHRTHRRTRKKTYFSTHRRWSV